MYKSLILLTFGAFPLLFLMPVAYAEEQGDKTRVQHYEGQVLQGSQEAKAVLKEKSAEIAELLKTETLSDADLEKIHEITYTLESSVDTLHADKSLNSAAVGVLDETVQALHFSSENHDEAKTREWFAKLEPAAGNLGAETASAASEQRDIYEIVIKDHKFIPEEITVPAGEKIKLRVDNQDATPEEFESHDMNREKIIPGNSAATIFVGPLKPGRHHFFGEFNADSANGYIVAE